MVAAATGTVIVTGASGGLGSVVASVLALRGYDVVAQYRSIAPKIIAPDHKVRLVKADLADESQARTLVDVAREQRVPWGVVNLAGGCVNAMSWKIGADDFANVLEQNVLTTHNVCRAVIPHMRDAHRGRIVNVTSIVGQTGLAGGAAYAAAKAAIVGYTKSLALELAPKGINVNAIAAGYFSAGLISAVDEKSKAAIMSRIPLGRLGDPRELADLVFALLSGEASNYLTGQVLGLNGGLR